MSPARRRLFLYVLLGLAVVWGAYSFRRPRPIATPPPATGAAADTAVVPRSDPPARQSDVSSLAARPWGEDPFRVRVRRTDREPAAPAPSWRLSGIVYSENHPLAIINSRPVGVGDRVDGAVVIDINKRQVTLEADGRRFQINVAAKG
ncbi:MAG TPA: hypothetical protein PK186_05775 [candidate division Zixibacteria bacterium]|nr:hypothetical protein [candidate division Zixibacteria bacterium]MDD4918608.1 hypothetical protein [candidate division Zixibacteria bacterium]MDM7974309.1 hypothetical protein [candidate division Zixibacteria bacterium]HOD66279.1 hypothetical protein [candidate division Zixibacteria bacterium]HPM37049.1 hypothetical protein [candidate division Zixibacteria bacterium]